MPKNPLTFAERIKRQIERQERRQRENYELFRRELAAQNARTGRNAETLDLTEYAAHLTAKK